MRESRMYLKYFNRMLRKKINRVLLNYLAILHAAKKFNDFTTTLFKKMKHYRLHVKIFSSKNEKSFYFGSDFKSRSLENESIY